MRKQSETDQLILPAIVSAGAMIAFQVGGKATRDAVFLSNFPVTALPGLLVVSAVFSVAAVVGASRVLSARGPGAVIPPAFGVSSILLLAEWIAFTAAPKAAAIVLYLHMASFGAILISGFWSIIAELFDPRAAKARIGRIAAGGTLGGLIGGILAERMGALFSIGSMLPVLAVLHFICAVLNYRLRPARMASPAKSVTDTAPPSMTSGFRVLRDVPYVKQLALLVLLGTIAETLLDYVLKSQASAEFNQGQQLMRFFALFYTGTSLITFLVQAALSRYALQQFGLMSTMSTMPFMVAAGGIGSLIWPGIGSTGFVRGAQSVLRSSLFRSGYELLYAPVPREEKRAAKTIVDVGFDRMGDAVGGGLIRIVLSLGLAASLSNQLLTFVAVVFGILALLLTARLSRGYINTLEKSLLNQAAELDLLDIEEKTTRATMLRTLGTVDLSTIRRPQQSTVERTHEPAAHAAEIDSITRRFQDLRSESAAVVRGALTGQRFLDPLLITPTIRLLARNDVSDDAVTVLRATVRATVGQLTDALLDPDEDFAVRRRIPRVLAHCPDARSIEGLMRGLTDSRFEVRFSCGRALSIICEIDQAFRPRAEDVYAATLKEIAIAGRLSEIPKVLDRYEDPSPSVSSWNSTNIRLEHIFRLLSLCLPREPLHVAFQALHTDDAYLKGTALEYLESILPSSIRGPLWQFLESPARSSAERRASARVLEELMQSRHRIEQKLSV